MIEAIDLRVRLGNQAVLNGVSLTVAPGEVTVLVGPNGAGKSTLLRALAGELTPSGGQITFEGRPLAQWRSGECARRRAVLPQQSTLSFPFHVIDVVLMGRTPHLVGSESSHDYVVAQAALRLVDAESLMRRCYTTLSGGERQRVHLARVLAQIWDRPHSGDRYLLLDEPTANLDLGNQHMMLRIAREFARARTGVLAVLHDLNLAARYADRIVALHAGCVRANGSPQEVLTARLIDAVFGVAVLVTHHPSVAGPLIIPLPQDAAATGVQSH